MAGSYGHVLDEEGQNYRGYSLLENMGDMKEGVHMMAFMLLYVQHYPIEAPVLPGDRLVKQAEDEYFLCFRGEKPWPEWFAHGNDNDENSG